MVVKGLAVRMARRVKGMALIQSHPRKDAVHPCEVVYDKRCAVDPVPKRGKRRNHTNQSLNSKMRVMKIQPTMIFPLLLQMKRLWTTTATVRKNIPLHLDENGLGNLHPRVGKQDGHGMLAMMTTTILWERKKI
jgi:hypothetical protein